MSTNAVYRVDVLTLGEYLILNGDGRKLARTHSQKRGFRENDFRRRNIYIFPVHLRRPQLFLGREEILLGGRRPDDITEISLPAFFETVAASILNVDPSFGQIGRG
jgi:hypothetical protein